MAPVVVRRFVTEREPRLLSRRAEANSSARSRKRVSRKKSKDSSDKLLSYTRSLALALSSRKKSVDRVLPAFLRPPRRSARACPPPAHDGPARVAVVLAARPASDVVVSPELEVWLSARRTASGSRPARDVRVAFARLRDDQPGVHLALPRRDGLHVEQRALATLAEVLSFDHGVAALVAEVRVARCRTASCCTPRS